MRVTIIPEDQTILVDGEALKFPFTADSMIHAIQWYGNYGTIEKKIGSAEQFDDFGIVQPFITLWQTRKDEIAALEAQP